MKIFYTFRKPGPKGIEHSGEPEAEEHCNRSS